MNVGELINRLRAWPADMTVLIAENQYGDEIHGIEKDEYFYSKEDGLYSCDPFDEIEESKREMQVVLLLKHQ